MGQKCTEGVALLRSREAGKGAKPPDSAAPGSQKGAKNETLCALLFPCNIFTLA